MVSTLMDLYSRHGRLGKTHWVTLNNALLDNENLRVTFAKLAGGLVANHTSDVACAAADRARRDYMSVVAWFVDARVYQIDHFASKAIFKQRLNESPPPDLVIIHPEGVDWTVRTARDFSAAIRSVLPDTPQAWYHQCEWTLRPESSGWNSSLPVVVSDYACPSLYSSCAEANRDILTRTVHHDLRMPVIPFIPFGFVGRAFASMTGSYHYPAGWRNAGDTWWLGRMTGSTSEVESVYAWAVTKPQRGEQRLDDFAHYVRGFFNES